MKAIDELRKAIYLAYKKQAQNISITFSPEGYRKIRSSCNAEDILCNDWINKKFKEHSFTINFNQKEDFIITGEQNNEND
jgi:hypothetical protein